MPITNVNSYLPTMDEFIAHWTEVNATFPRGSTGLTLKGGYTLENFTADRTALQTAMSAIINAENTRQFAAGQRDALKGPLRARLSQFRSAVQSQLQGTAYQAMLPTLPAPNVVETRFLTPFDDVLNLWRRIDADTTTPGFTAPLTTGGGYTSTQFETDLAAMRTAFIDVTGAESTVRLAREQRDMLLEPIRQRLNQYRAAVRANFAANDPLVQSLPAMSPPAGATPDAVTLTGTWDATRQKAVLTWTASDNADLAHYSLRTAPARAIAPRTKRW